MNTTRFYPDARGIEPTHRAGTEFTPDARLGLPSGLSRLLRIWLLAIAVVAATSQTSAQWLKQSFDLAPGWNAIYLHVDASYASATELLSLDPANPIEEVWMWDPAPATVQFIETPQLPTATGSQWLTWSRSLGSASSLQRLLGNAAYLVKRGGAVGTYRWDLLGKPLAPHYAWTSSGQNFLGFPTPTDRYPAFPSFEAFLAPASGLQSALEIYAYTGGELSASNPARVYAHRSTYVRHGEAFWLRATNLFNQYFGPFTVELDGTSIGFGDSSGQRSLRLRNNTARDLSVSLALLASAAPPTGQPGIVQPPPLLLRGDRNPTNLTYASTPLSIGSSLVKRLAPKGQAGSELELVLGVNRSAMVNSPGALYAGLLQFKDELGLSQIDVGVSASVAANNGLWVGEALVRQVRHNLRQWQKDSNGVMVVASNGQYVPASANTSMGSVGRAFPLRLILHNDRVNTVLLQRVYCGIRQSNSVVATQEVLLDKDSIDSARRISATHLPWSAANIPWVCAGSFALGGQLTATINLAYDDQASNPFLHTYHPDHDNLDAQFSSQPLARGEESYGVRRVVTLTFTAPTGDFSSLTATGQTLSGDYEETITLTGKGAESRQYAVRGAFSLTRISNIPTLTTP